MDTRHNDLTGASIPPFAGVMDDDPVPDPPMLSAVPSPPQQIAAPVPGYGQYQVAAPVSMLAPVGAAAFGGVTAPVSDYDSFPFTSPTYMFYPGVSTRSMPPILGTTLRLSRPPSGRRELSTSTVPIPS